MQDLEEFKIQLIRDFNEYLQEYELSKNQDSVGKYVTSLHYEIQDNLEEEENREYIENLMENILKDYIKEDFQNEKNI